MINDPRAGRIRNRLNAIDSVKPNYDVKKNRRELDVLCYTEGKVIHVIDQCDPKDVKEGDYGIQGDKTYKYTNGQWEEIQAQ